MNDIDRAAVFYRTLRSIVNNTDWGIHTEIHNNHDNTLTVTCCIAAKEVIKQLRREAAMDGVPLGSVIGIPTLPLVTCTVTTRHSDYSAVLQDNVVLDFNTTPDYTTVLNHNTALDYNNQPVAEILDAEAHLHGVPSLCADQPDQALCLHAPTEYLPYTLITVEMLVQQLQALAQMHLSAQPLLIPAENILFN